MANVLRRGGGKALLGMLALLQLSAAEGESCTPPEVIDISQISRLQGCNVIQGSVTILLPPIGSTHPISLPSLQTVEGDLTFSVSEALDGIRRPADWTIELDALDQVWGNLTFRGLSLSRSPITTRLSADALTFDNVIFNIATDSEDVEVDLGVSVRSIIVSGCSGVTKLETELISDSGSPLSNASFTAMGNPSLAEVTLRGYGNLSTDVNVQNNDPAMSVVLDDLSTGSLNLAGVQQFQAIALASLVPNVVTGSGSAFEDNTVTAFEFPALTTTGEAPVVFADNFHLESISMPNLGYISNLSIVSKSTLETVDLSGVQTIGILQVSGQFNTINFPDASSVDITNSVALKPQDNVCPTITRLQGNYSCSPGSEFNNASSQGNDASSPSDNPAASGGGGGLSTAAKIGIGVGVGLGGLLLLLAALFIFFRKRRSRRPNPRTMKSDEWRFTSDKGEHSPVRYTKVPAVTDTAEEPSPHSSHRPVSGPMPDDWTPPTQGLESTDGRVELEEQQGARHEMDARSLPDIDLQEDDEEDARSLQDIERAHRSTG